MTNGESRVQRWQRTQQALTDSSAMLFDKEGGKEIAAFEEAVALLHECFEAAESCEAPEKKIALGILSQTYQQLVSSWRDLKEGRLAAAAAHWRSLAEAPDFISAVAINREYALEWADEGRRKTMPTKGARQIVRKWLDQEKPGAGTEWAAERAKSATRLHQFSHVTVAAANQTTIKVASGKGFFLAPEGAYLPRLRFAAMYLCSLARDVLVSAGYAFNDAMSDDWNRDFDWFVQSAGGILEREAAEFASQFGALGTERSM